ncbi:E3 ubiquitin-protein ligase TRIM56-like [Glandiceps talaboti]
MATADPSKKFTFDPSVLTCRLCSNQYDKSTRIPKYLPCLHVFCQPCLTKQIGKDEVIKCQICSECTKTKQKGAIGFQTSATILNQKEYYEKQQNLQKGQDISCQSCHGKKGDIAVSFCLDCVAFLCQFCHDAHTHTFALGAHDVLTLSDLKSYPWETIETFIRPKQYCSKRNHENHEITLYCDSDECQVPLCLQCAFVTHPRSEGHMVMEIGKTTEKYKEIITDKINTAAEKVFEIHS